MTLHNSLTGNELHEPINISDATAGAADVGKTVVSKGDGTSEVRKLLPSELGAGACRMGWSSYDDVTTQSTPIVLSSTGTFFNLTNDGAGAQSHSEFELPEVTDIWDTATNQLDLSDLSIGDTVDFRVDIEVTTTGANHQIEIQLDMDTAPITANFQLLVDRENFKSAGTFQIIKYYSLFIGSQAVVDGVHKVQIKSDSGTTNSVKVNGWYIRAIIRSDY